MAGIAQNLSVSHSGPLTPRYPKSWLITPYCGLSTHFQIRLAATQEVRTGI